VNILGFSSQENAVEEDVIITSVTKVLDAISLDTPYTSLNEMDFLLKMLPVQFKKDNKLLTLEKKLKNFLLVPQNQRLLRKNSITKSEAETSHIYYDVDRGQDESLFYMEDFEIALMEIQDEMRSACAIIITKKLSAELVLS